MHADHDDQNQLSSRALDTEQLVRIEATHRGFGYQHLYAVACLLDMEAGQTEVVIVEHDEDVELIRRDSHTYIQVKTRNRSIQFADLDSALDRFSKLRVEHSEGRRVGTAQFAFVCNEEPGPELRKRLAESSWPTDVVFISPGCPTGAGTLFVPVPWPDLRVALQSCEAMAAQIPFASLAPSTLVLKLAGLVQYLATGHGGHAVSRGQVSDFYERLVVQLHDFPRPPADYRPHAGEPSLVGANRVRLVIAVSGAGKTAWAAHAALLHPSPTVYFDIGELPGSALASSLARELVARFLIGDSGTGGAALPVASGLELLSLVSRRIAEAGREVIVVLDNVHRVSAATLYRVQSAAAEIRFVLLGQAWAGQAELEARLEIQAETLAGWSLDDVAVVFAAAGCPIDAATGQHILDMTGGVPLYVKNSAQLTADAYSGNASAFVQTVTQRLNVVNTSQEVILAEAFEQLSPEARTAAALLELVDVPLRREEALELITASGGTGAANASAIRELARSGVVQLSYQDSLKLHDAFRLLARDAQAQMPQSTLGAARETLVGLLENSLPSIWTIGRFGLFARLLPQTGRVSTLVTLATYEQFRQITDPQELKAALESAAQESELSKEDRFWALDALVYWEYSEGIYDRIGKLVAQMAKLADGSDFSAGALAELSMKQMLVAAFTNNQNGIDSAYEAGLQYIASDPRKLKILQYNRALVRYQTGAYEEAGTIAFDLLMEYYDDLNLDLNDVLLSNVNHILSVAPDTPDRDDLLRHAGDCLDLMAICHMKLGQPAQMAYLHAMKFYNAAGAWRSAIRAGQDAVDAVLDLGDLIGARKICEDFLLPVVVTYQLSDLLVPVRAQYAVVLAWCGDFESARNEMTTVEAYRVSEIGAEELANQRALIEQIAAVSRDLTDTEESP